MSSGLAVLCLLLLLSGALGFKINRGNHLTHQQITERAILNTTVQVCRSLAAIEGKDFSFPPQPLTAQAVVVACDSPKSSKNYHKAIKLIRTKNARVDIWYFWNANYHFDNERFKEGREIITGRLSAVKASNKQGNFEAARKNLGRILHPLQDFYSHSNWIEMGNKFPNSNLLRSGTSIGNIADKSRATCRNCIGNDCRNNILEDILREKILTTGYFGLIPFFSKKPKGKCSHGDAFDQTRKIEPKGGINKDTVNNSHGFLHFEAANVAVAATSELLEDVRRAAGDRDFLQMLGISKGSKALCFVIDTTGSMGDDIQNVREVTTSIIDSKVGTEDEPLVYVLVPFNDPDFGPLKRTNDPKVFKREVNSLTARGGGDSPEMSLSGLQLALTGSPPGSEIFVFTDASAKDSHLRSTVIALIERTKSVVNFMITGILGSRSRRQGDQQQQLSRMSSSGTQLYRDLARASGGQAIEVTKSQLPLAISIITESTTSSLVTLLQVARDPGRSNNFTFTVDDSVKNVTIYITGRSFTFTLIGPSGENSTGGTGSLIKSSLSVGNLQTLQLETQVGQWEMRMVSTKPYTLKVVGQSPIDFLFDFLVETGNMFNDLDVLDGRPKAGVNSTLSVSVTGSDSATVTAVALVETSGSGRIDGTVEPQGDGEFLVRFDRIPSAEFVVNVRGRIDNSSSRAASVLFERQSLTNVRPSSLTITAQTDGILAPGTPFSVPFTVTINGTGGNFRIQATNDQGFTSTSPSTLFLGTDGSANGTVTLTAPPNTPSGNVVTLTIEAESPGATDTNFVVLQLTILEKVTDITQPECQLLSLQSNCSDSCSSMWELSVNVTDGVNGTGIRSINHMRGNGTMNTSMVVGANGENVTLVSYKASCCSPDVEIVTVDEVGNVGSCSFTIRATTISPQPQNTTTTSSPESVNTTTTSSPESVNNTIISSPQVAATTPASLATKAAPSLLLCLCIRLLGLNLLN